MRTSSDLLWKLVRSMSAAEKLYFRRNFARPGSNSLYLRIFDALARQKTYDEEALLRKFNPSLHRRNIASQKNYLYRQLCEALIHCDTAEDSMHEIYKQFQLIRLLRKKGMLDEAHTLWKKTVVKARHAEAFAFLNLLKGEFGKMILFSGNHTSQGELLSLFQSNLITYRDYGELIVLRDMYTELLLLKARAHYEIDENLRAKLEGMLERVKQSEKKFSPPSFWFRHYLRMTKATLLYLLNELDESLQLLTLCLQEWREKPAYLQSDGEYYIELLYMINYVGIARGEFAFVIGAFNHPVNQQVSKVHQANFEAIKFLALNKIYNKTARYGEVEKLIDHVKSRYRHWEPMLNADMNRTLTMSVGIAMVVLEKYDDALYFIRRGISYYRAGGREETVAVGHLLLLVVCYAANNSRLFDAQYKAAYGYFYKRQKKHSFQAAIMQCLQKTFYLPNRRDREQFFTRCLASLEKTGSDKVQQSVFNIFNFPGWLTARMQGITYRQYVERAYRARHAA